MRSTNSAKSVRSLHSCIVRMKMSSFAMNATSSGMNWKTVRRGTNHCHDKTIKTILGMTSLTLNLWEITLAKTMGTAILIIRDRLSTTVMTANKHCVHNALCKESISLLRSTKL